MRLGDLQADRLDKFPAFVPWRTTEGPKIAAERLANAPKIRGRKPKRFAEILFTGLARYGPNGPSQTEVFKWMDRCQ